MKRLKIVFDFEFTELIKKKSMLISTGVIAFMMLAATFAPTIISKFQTSKEEAPEISESVTDLGNILVVSEDNDLLDYLKASFGEFEGIEFSEKIDDVNDLVLNDSYSKVYIMEKLDTFTVIKKDSGFDYSESMFEEILRSTLIDKNLIDEGMDPQHIYQILNPELKVTYETLGKDATQGIAFGFIALIALYMLILLYGQLVATSVAREKDSRTMELLITSTNPKTLIVGKVFAAGLVGFVQVAFIALVAVVGFYINKANYPEMLVMMISESLNFDVVLMYILFSFSGYILYLFIYAALGSLVSKVEDVGTAVSSITVVFVVAYLIASAGMSSPNSTLVKISSFVPFVSLFTMPIRYMMTTVALYEVLISLSLMMLVIVLIAKLSIYIYRLGSLNYGNRMKLLKVIKDIF